MLVILTAVSHSLTVLSDLEEAGLCCSYFVVPHAAVLAFAVMVRLNYLKGVEDGDSLI